MRLSELLQPLLLFKIVSSGSPINADPVIRGITADSRRIREGDLFICLPGALCDGHDFAAEAASNGAAAVLGERMALGLDAVSIPFIQVPDSRRAMAVLADRFYARPSAHLRMIGVTGTNGKTTVTHMIRDILEADQRKTGLIGTLNMTVGQYSEPTANTTPDALELQRMLHVMRREGASHAVLEVSSHALAMGRVRSVDMDIAVFTNLTHDHLDYHETMDQYRNAKAHLFAQLDNACRPNGTKFAILNGDEPASFYYGSQTAAQVIRYAIDNNEAEVRASDVELRPDGSRARVDTMKGSFELSLQVPGLFNIYNALAAAAACLVEGVPLETIRGSLERFGGVKGRFQRLQAGQPFSLLIDYAHNPDGLRNVLQAAKTFTRGRVVCVVGCEGDRDRPKRPVMAEIAALHADLAVFTSDNTRSEQPEAILHEMNAGLADKPELACKTVSIADRREAIYYALRQAEYADDCVIIAGKGHEAYQIVGDKKIPFDDALVARDAVQLILEERGLR
ncbi:UDP-N-acetylmuramoyl-L-alanyl-D-glutamate--2,6-diaminopimelate ligase [Paenibacillus turpanensis]|uniref:UDP-N-acetylmuramoyl-L-alanyl-D-glutamate--2, 6-diaminopimelate ligase n=1 Tax=Paenibacillus turpanensis TaxID=2689078 RepID=UPI00140C8D26|nr:UDP-N-acetylmuramoyl-L-alanyl-D-glutamate--2,6-diaminopimelate ligase [Paenibacillus turpanensis]